MIAAVIPLKQIWCSSIRYSLKFVFILIALLAIALTAFRSYGFQGYVYGDGVWISSKMNRSSGNMLYVNYRGGYSGVGFLGEMAPGSKEFRRIDLENNVLLTTNSHQILMVLFSAEGSLSMSAPGTWTGGGEEWSAVYDEILGSTLKLSDKVLAQLERNSRKSDSAE